MEKLHISVILGGEIERKRGHVEASFIRGVVGFGLGFGLHLLVSWVALERVGLGMHEVMKRY